MEVWDNIQLFSNEASIEGWEWFTILRQQSDKPWRPKKISFLEILDEKMGEPTRVRAESYGRKFHYVL